MSMWLCKTFIYLSFNHFLMLLIFISFSFYLILCYIQDKQLKSAQNNKNGSHRLIKSHTIPKSDLDT